MKSGLFYKKRPRPDNFDQ
jgi:DNA excision repair protein ERCC-4